jgi:hypothetical protein
MLQLHIGVTLARYTLAHDALMFFFSDSIRNNDNSVSYHKNDSVQADEFLKLDGLSVCFRF